jgi:hypothetical protein
LGELLEEETLDVAVGRNKPTKDVEEQTIGNVRNIEGGTQAGLGNLPKSELQVLMSR